MATNIDQARSPFERAAREGLVGGEGVVGYIDSNVRKSDHGPKDYDWVPLFLAAIATAKSIQQATKAAGIHFTLVYQRRKVDPEFRRAWNEAAEIGTRLLEQEAQRRAVHGVEVGVFYKGEVVGHERKYSDNLLMFLLKARKPAKYRDFTAPESAPTVINVNVATVTSLEEAAATVQGVTVEGTTVDGAVQVPVQVPVAEGTPPVVEVTSTEAQPTDGVPPPTDTSPAEPPTAPPDPRPRRTGWLA